MDLAAYIRASTGRGRHFRAPRSTAMRVVGQFELLRLLNRLFRLIVRLRLNDPSLHKQPVRKPPEPRAAR